MRLILTHLEGKYWEVVRDFKAYSEISKEFIKIPEGFRSDLASVPKCLQSIISPINNSVEPAVIHDYLYANKVYSRKECDMIFKDFLKIYKVKKWKIFSMYWAVRLFGRKHYEKTN